MNAKQTAFCKGYTEMYLTIYRELAPTIMSSEAAVAATNGAMIAADRAGLLKFEEPQAQAVLEVAPGEKVEAGQMVKVEEGKAVPVKEEPKGEVLPEHVRNLDGPAYDPESKRWNYCDEHPQEELKSWTAVSGRFVQLCPACDAYLNGDGKKRPRGAKRDSRALRNEPTPNPPVTGNESLKATTEF